MVPSKSNNLTDTSTTESVELDHWSINKNENGIHNNTTTKSGSSSLSQLPRYLKNNAFLNHNKKPSSSTTQQRQSWESEPKNEENSSHERDYRVAIGGERQKANNQNTISRHLSTGNNRKNSRKTTTLSSLRTKIFKKMRRSGSYSANSSTTSITEDNEKGFGEDITDFHGIEQQKTMVRKRLKFYATLLFFLAVIATALALVDTQMTIKWEREMDVLKNARVNETFTKISGHKFKTVKESLYTYRVIGITMKSLISVVSIATCFALYLYYKNLFYLKTVRFFYPKDMSFFRATPLVKKMLIECCICILHVPPFMDYVVAIPNQVQVLVFLRLYLLGRYIKEKHELMNSQSTRFLASVTKTELTSMFLFKTFFMQYPFQMILLAYVILLFIGGYGVWLIEERYSYLDTVWMLIITMTTVGFGDLTPKTMPGRFAVGITAIVGIFLMALFISLVNEALMLQRREKRILAYVENQDSTRRRKVSALNAIGMWFKYRAHLKKHFGMKETEVLIGRGIRAQAKKDIVSIVKAKLLETRMYRAVNEWRKIKNARGGSGFFAQEFMIEDMKNMMTDITQRMNEFDEKMDTISADVKTMTDITNKTKRISTDKEPDSQTQKRSSPYDMADENIGNDHIDHMCHLQQQNYSSDISTSPHDGIVAYNQNTESNSPSSNNRHAATTMKARELLPDGKNNRRSKSIQKSELQMAFKLLKNQAKIMNNALDDIYYKTRQDICDMENIINSLLICSDVEDGIVDYVPSHDWSVEYPNA